ncbi:hypothetical protein LINPERHAP1_LOCUS13970, partial [Linum perenne]
MLDELYVRSETLVVSVEHVTPPLLCVHEDPLFGSCMNQDISCQII